ncbi:serine-rich adhesin for platelets-like isoform X2 [Dreissena polymorpha]|uniref:serine-rich adhesin for platelets-like isoform X2 n=1 Tax=Dreissena polymorpha TaxID=45954 RepID=UPI0022648055|nr:serine-rich adhesin for platelets-like isoform X2 [Dreissena polymorpha]
MDSELDITGDESLEDVDDSCLMSVAVPGSAFTTPEWKGRGKKDNATAELAADEDVFVIPEVPATKKICTEITSVDSEAVTREELNKEAEKEPSQDLSAKRGRSTEKSGKTSPQKSRSSGGKKSVSPRKDSEKRKVSHSPADSSPEKRIASESPARRNQEKRKASSPVTERKMKSKSPNYKAKEEKISSSKGTGENKVAQSPIKESLEGDKSPSKQKSSASLTSPGASKAGQKAKPKVTEKDAELPMAKTDAKINKNARKPFTVTATSEKDVRKAANKNVSNKITYSPNMARAKSVRVSVSMSEKSQADATLAATNFTRIAGEKRDAGVEMAAENSPRNAGKEKDAVAEKAEVADKSGRSLVKLVGDKPEKSNLNRRTSTRSVLDTPEISSPKRATRAVVEESVAETPEHATGKASASASVLVSPPPSAARVTHASLSQSSTQSPRSPGRGGVKFTTQVSRSSSQSQETPAAGRIMRGSGNIGSLPSSSMSLISTLASQSTGSQHTGSQSSTASHASRKPAAAIRLDKMEGHETINRTVDCLPRVPALPRETGTKNKVRVPSSKLNRGDKRVGINQDPSRRSTKRRDQHLVTHLLIPEYFPALSIRISDVLDDIGAGKCTVMERRGTYLRIERMMMIARQITGIREDCFHFGSQSEGSTTPGLNSDIDLLKSHNEANIMTDWRDWEAGIDNFLMLLDENTPPQQYLLQVFDKCKPEAATSIEDNMYVRKDSGQVLFSSERWKQDSEKILSDSKNREIFKNGPSVSGDPNWDIVSAVHVCKPLSEIRHWIDRCRGKHWPPAQ